MRADRFCRYALAPLWLLASCDAGTGYDISPTTSGAEDDIRSSVAFIVKYSTTARQLERGGAQIAAGTVIPSGWASAVKIAPGWLLTVRHGMEVYESPDYLQYTGYQPGNFTNPNAPATAYETTTAATTAGVIRGKFHPPQRVQFSFAATNSMVPPGANGQQYFPAEGLAVASQYWIYDQRVDVALIRLLEDTPEPPVPIYAGPLTPGRVAVTSGFGATPTSRTLGVRRGGASTVFTTNLAEASAWGMAAVERVPLVGADGLPLPQQQALEARAQLRTAVTEKTQRYQNAIAATQDPQTYVFLGPEGVKGCGGDSGTGVFVQTSRGEAVAALHLGNMGPRQNCGDAYYLASALQLRPLVPWIRSIVPNVAVTRQ